MILGLLFLQALVLLYHAEDGFDDSMIDEVGGIDPMEMLGGQDGYMGDNYGGYGGYGDEQAQKEAIELESVGDITSFIAVSDY